MGDLKVICEPRSCCGCMACVNSCTHNAILVKKDMLHFDVPVIDVDKCVNCGLCAKNCQVLNPIQKNEELPSNSYAIYAKDKGVHEQSASGGASAVFMHHILEQGGVAYGVVMPDSKRVYHKKIESIKDIPLTQGSKYVQSEIGDTYKYVKQDLISGKKVLFTGTPCQIGGLKKFLHKQYPNLITVELVCHGVSSLGLLSDHLSSCLNEENNNHLTITFREKKHNEGVKYVTTVKDGNRIAYKNYNDCFIKSFELGLTLRESCYTCPYTSPNRIADITIGDFWGLGQIADNSFDTANGVSGIIINTPKGVAFFNECQGSFNIQVRDFEEFVNGNGATKHSATRVMFRNRFIQEYHNGNFTCVATKLLEKSLSFNKRLKTIHRYHLGSLYLMVRRCLHKMDFDSDYYNKQNGII